MSEETKTESAPNNSNQGLLATTAAFLERQNKLAERIEQANKKTEELLMLQETLFARNLVAGRSEAGIQTPEVSKEDKLKAEMKAYFKGSAIEHVI